MPRSTSFLFRTLPSCLALSWALMGCGVEHQPPENHAAMFEQHELLVAPGSDFSATIVGVENRHVLWVRASEPSLDVDLGHREPSGWFTSERHYATGSTSELGTFSIELHDGRELRDTLVVRVEPVDDVVLTGAQHHAPDPYPEFPVPMALVTDHYAVIIAEAVAADGAIFDAAPERLGWLSFDDPALEGDAFGPIHVRASAPGIYPLRYELLDGEVRSLPLRVVSPDAVVALAVDVLEVPPRAAISVRGITATGESVLGLEPEVRVAGRALTSTIGDWLFETATPIEPGCVEAQWGGLAVTY